MNALLYKDFVSAKKTYILSLAIIGINIFFAVSQQIYIIIPLLFTFLPLLLNGIGFNVDEQAHAPQFIFCSPISRKTYVISKYAMTLFCALIAAVLSVAVFLYQHVEVSLVLILSTIIAGIPIVISSIQIPFFLKYGAEKGRIVMVAIFFLIFALSSFLGDNLEDVMSYIQQTTQSMPYLIWSLILFIILIIFFLSIRTGIQIMEKKEF